MRPTHAFIGLCLILALGPQPALGDDVKDLFFGEALYHARQGQYFEAIQRLDTELAQYHGLDEPKLDTLQYHVNEAEFSVGDFELEYRMHHRAGRAIKRVLEGNVEDAVRNEAAFRHARIFTWPQDGQATPSKCSAVCKTIRVCQGLSLTTSVLLCCRPAGKRMRLNNWIRPGN